jgi:NAD(P) transhydrogenase subunit beta
MSINVVVLLYLVASVCFIQALKGLSHPTTSIRGNVFGMTGMAIAVLTTVALVYMMRADVAGMGLVWVAVGIAIGGGAGALMANRVEMTKMPELVAFMHSMIGLAAVFIGIAAVAEPWAFGIAAKGTPIPVGNRLELFLGAAIGAITFSGSVIAFGKLSGQYKFRLFQGAPVVFSGQHMLNRGARPRDARARPRVHVHRELDRVPRDARAVVRARRADHHPDRRRRHAGRGVDAQQLLGLGGGRHRLLAEQQHADHRRLLVGSSGAILSYIMCKAMNRSFFNVILGGFGGDAAAADRGRRPSSAPVRAARPTTRRS